MVNVDSPSNEWSELEWEVKTQSALRGSNLGFQGHRVSSIGKRRVCNHSHIAFPNIKLGEKPSLPAFAKRYVQIGYSTGPLHNIFINPDRLFTRELGNLELLRQYVATDMVPRVYGTSTKDRLIVAQRAPGKSHRHKIISANNEILGRKSGVVRKQKAINRQRSLLKELVRYGVARFVGLSTANQKNLYSEHPGFIEEAKVLDKVEQTVFQENLLKLVYRSNRSKFRRRAYDPEAAEELLSRHIGIKGEVENLFELLDTFKTRKVFGHRDFNPDHFFGNRQIGYMVVDLETCGPCDLVSDISSALIIAPLGYNRFIDDKNLFPYLFHEFLLFENAYENDPEKVEYFKKSHPKKFKPEEVGLESEEYAKARMGMLAYAAKKHLSLASREASKINRPNDLVRLVDFALHDPYLDKCPNKEEMVQYFNDLSSLCRTIGYLK